MLAIVLSFDSYRHLDSFHYPVPKWVGSKSIVFIRRPPKGLNAALVKEFGEAVDLIGHCVAIARLCGITVDDFKNLFSAIMSNFGIVPWSNKMMGEIESAIECPGLDRSTTEILSSWQAQTSAFDSAKRAYDAFRFSITAAHGSNWLPRNMVLRHAALLIEIVRKEAKQS